MLKVFNTYNRFFKEYQLLLLAVIMTVFIGIIAGPVTYVVAPLVLIAFYNNKRYRKSALLFFFFILIMSDSLKPYFQFFKTIRVECIVLLFLFALRYIIYKKRVDKNLLYILPFVSCLFISLFYSPTFVPTALRTLSYLFLPVIIFSLYKEEVLASKGYFIKDILLFASIFIIIGHILFIVAPEMVKSYGEGNEIRISGLFGNPNGLAIFCFLLFPILLYVNRFGILNKASTNFLIYLLLFSILISGSRTSLGGSLIFFIYWIANKYNIFFRFFLKLIIPVLIVLSVTIGVQVIASSDYLSKRLRLSTLESAGGRLDAWRWGYQQVPKHLYFGRGLLYDTNIYQINFPESFRRVNRGFNAAFSGVLGLLLDSGVVGTVAFVFFIFMSFSKFQDKKIVIPLFLAMLLSWIFESWILATLNPFTIIFFIQILVFQNLPTKK